MAAPQNNQAKITFDAYGDESIHDNFVIYALVIIPVQIADIANNVLVDVKKEYGVEESAKIHCSDIFHPVGRSRTCWANLTTKQILRSWKEIGSRLSLLGAESRISYIDRRRFSDRLKFGSALYGTPMHEKILARIAFGCCCAGLEKIPGINQIRFWLDPEKTNLQWGEKTLKSMDIPINLEGEKMLSQAITSPKPAMLDVADILAYTAMRTLNYPSEGIINAKRVFQSFKASERTFDFVEQAFTTKPGKLSKNTKLV